MERPQYENIPNITIANAVGTIGSIHPRGFGFVVFTAESGHKTRIWFHLKDTDGTEFELRDKVSFDMGIDSQQRTRAFNVRLIAAHNKPTDGAL
jgi:hypothetical protein